MTSAAVDFDARARHDSQGASKGMHMCRLLEEGTLEDYE